MIRAWLAPVSFVSAAALSPSAFSARRRSSAPSLNVRARGGRSDGDRFAVDASFALAAAAVSSLPVSQTGFRRDDKWQPYGEAKAANILVVLELSADLKGVDAFATAWPAPPS